MNEGVNFAFEHSSQGEEIRKMSVMKWQVRKQRVKSNFWAMTFKPDLKSRQGWNAVHRRLIAHEGKG